MKKRMGIWILIVVLALLGIGTAVFTTGCFSGNTADSETSEQLYTCGMHPWVIQEGPGQCPICGMNLVPKENQAETASNGERQILYWVSSMDPGYVRQEPGKDTMGMDLVPVYADQAASGAIVSVDPSIIQSIGVRYATVERGPMSLSINAPAHVDYNEDHLAVLSTRTDGYIDKLYVTSPGASVKEGDPLFDFYAPQLYSAQEEYLIALRTGDSSLSSAARERLKLLGVSDEQINGIRENGSSSALTITAPMDGVVITMGGSGTGGGLPQGGGGLSTGGMGGGSQSSSGGGMGGMGGTGGGGGFSDSGGGSSSPVSGMSSGSGGTLREGAFVSAGSPVFTIADLSTVWVYAHIYSDQLSYIQTGMPATLEMDYLPGQTFEGTIDFIYPYLETLTRDIRVRIVFPNPDGKLLPEMYGTVKIQSLISDDTLLIPEEAVIFSGDHRIVFLSLPGNKFAPVEVTLGPSDGNGKVQVLSGLVEGQQIVTSAQFLIDAESRMQEAISKMLAGQTSTTSPEEAVSTVQTEEQPVQTTDDTMAGMDMPTEEWPNLAPDDPNARWRCPMPEDRYYAAEPGDCPICGMHLEPHDPAAWAQEHGEANIAGE
ncbi:MAG: efflux RND transporter periplasmic adaptor subunit [bacterium]|nr:efflux RND transporter periplasmic adaptor subunit [bacterium]